MEISTVTGSAGVFLLFFLAEVFILCIHSSYFLLSLKTHMSAATRKLQQKFFVDMIFQVSFLKTTVIFFQFFNFRSLFQSELLYYQCYIVFIRLFGSNTIKVSDFKLFHESPTVELTIFSAQQHCYHVYFSTRNGLNNHINLAESDISRVHIVFHNLFQI